MLCSDAANDCHSGLTLYRRLHAMMSDVEPAPKPDYFTFDLFNGDPRHPSSQDVSPMLWHPHNPNYDPGPPPEPKIPKEKKEKKEGTIDGNDTNSATHAGQGSNRTSRPWRQQPPYSTGLQQPIMTALGASDINQHTAMGSPQYSQSRQYHQHHRGGGQPGMPPVNGPPYPVDGPVPPHRRGRGGGGGDRGGYGRGGYGGRVRGRGGRGGRGRGGDPRAD